jgi:hypothetical protein
MATQVYVGDREDINIYMGDDVISYDFTILDYNDVAYDFTGLTALTFSVFATRPSNLTDQASPTLQLTNGSGVSYASNVVSWDLDYSADLTTTGVGDYYYEIQWLNSTSQPQTVCFGTLKVV